MTERLLQFIWQFQYFNKQQLCTHDGALLQIIQPGKYNTHQGPDFLQATIRLGGTLLVGHIELHINTADWQKHRHDEDANYKNVVLHVVWQHDDTSSPGNLPLLELQNRVSVLLLRQYNEWMERASFVACSAVIHDVKPLVWFSWNERLLAERLQRKSGYVLELLNENQFHWQQTCWQLLARNFGMQVNADAFEAIARSIPMAVLLRHKNQLPVLEALLLGQAGLLEDNFTDTYASLLQREYIFHRHKYKLPNPQVAVFFLRMRPAAFPSIRLAQLAMLFHRCSHFFAAIIEAQELQQVLTMLELQANDYWHYHYKPGNPSPYKIKKLGNGMMQNIIINTVAPMLFAYGLYHSDEQQKKKALRWLEQIPPEKNSVTAGWQKLKIANKHAYHSQALIELKTQYCDVKRCLDCAVGNALLRKNT